MKWLGLLVISTAVYASSVAAQAHVRCQNTIGGPCGDSSRPREYNCCDYGYCQPWNSGYYQCVNKPDKCPNQETDIDYAGNDIKTIRGILPDKCCEECSNTAGCTVYTFVNQNPDGKSACYLKKSAAGRVEKKGAVSGALSTIPPPPNCPVQERGVDYYGNDLKTVTGVDWYGCCDECAKTAKCVGYTYIEQTNSCYLKSSTAGKVAKVGAISGKVKEDPVTTAPPTTEPPPAKCSVQEKDIDYYGNDLKSVTGVFQGACCDECVKTDRCIAYTFVPATSSSKTGTCYLKSATAGKVPKAGVISGVVDGSWTQPPITLPPPPSDCPVQYNNIDFFGDDLKTLYALTQGGCCDECTKMPACMGYTFIAKGPDGRTACYLKGSTRGQVAKIGAVSGTPRYIKPPANCPNQELNIEYAGFDIKEVKDLTYGQCCDACGKTPGCRATTFLEVKDGKSSCRLKSNAVRKVSLTGAISSVYSCPTPLYGSCGSAATGAFCCPLDGYCQPWNSKFYQCMPRPDFMKCRDLVTDVDFYGGDIEVKYDLQPGDCCDACFKNMKCIAYTFVNENPDGKTACYLKDRVGEKRAKLGAMSGYRAIEA